MENQIEGFEDDNKFIIIKGILYKKEKYDISNRYKYTLINNMPYDVRLFEEALGIDSIDIKSNDEIKTTIIGKVENKSLNYTNDIYFDTSQPFKKNKKSKKKKFLLSEKKIKKNEIIKDKKNKNVLKQKKIKYKNECLFYDNTVLLRWFNDDIYHGYKDDGFSFVAYDDEYSLSNFSYGSDSDYPWYDPDHGWYEPGYGWYDQHYEDY